MCVGMLSFIGPDEGHAALDPAYVASLFQNQLRVKEDEKTLVLPVLNSALSPVSSRGGAEEEALAKSASTSSSSATNPRVRTYKSLMTMAFIFSLWVCTFLSPSLFFSFITASHSASGDRELSNKTLEILPLDLRELELKHHNDKHLDLGELELKKHNAKTRTFQDRELAENELTISYWERENEAQEELRNLLWEQELEELLVDKSCPLDLLHDHLGQDHLEKVRLQQNFFGERCEEEA